MRTVWNPLRGLARRSKASSDAWARRTSNGTKTHKRSQQRNRRLWKERKLNPPIYDSIHIQHDLIRDFLTYLREIPPNRYTRRINAAKSSVEPNHVATLETYWPPPPKTCRVSKCGRTYNSWCDMPTGIRTAVFSGDLDLDISKCHFTIFNIILSQLGIEQVEIEALLSDCEAHKISREKAKELINSTIHGAGGKAYKKMMGGSFSAVEDLPPTLNQLKIQRSELFLGRSLTTPFGDSIELFEGKWISNKKKWNTVFYLWETWLKIMLFHNLDNAPIIFDIYDGVIVNVRDKRLGALKSTLSEIESRCLKLTKELGLCDVIKFSHNLL